MVKSIMYVLVFVFLSCKTNTKDNAEKAKVLGQELQKKSKVIPEKVIVDVSEYLITDCDTLSLERLSIREEERNCVTLKPLSFVYCSPSIKSTIIDTLKFNTEFENKKHIVRFLYNEKKEFKGERFFFKITINDKQGYVLEEDLAIKKIENRIILGKLGHNKYKILSIDKNEKIIDSLFFDGHSSSDINLSKEKVLPFDERLICFRTYRTSCPGASAMNFVSIDKKGKIKKVISSYDNTMGSSSVCFPTAVKNGVVKFSYVGFEDDSEDDSPVGYEYLKSLKTPIDELIIESETTYKGDIEGLEEEEIEIASAIINVYKWEEGTLQKIRTLDVNKLDVLKSNTTNYPKSGKAYVIAKNGLTYREKPSINATKIDTFDFGTEVIIEENSGVLLELTDEGEKLNGEWVKVKAKRNSTYKTHSFGADYKYSGYVFNGFLVDSIHTKFKK